MRVHPAALHLNRTSTDPRRKIKVSSIEWLSLLSLVVRVRTSDSLALLFYQDRSDTSVARHDTPRVSPLQFSILYSPSLPAIPYQTITPSHTFPVLGLENLTVLEVHGEIMRKPGMSGFHALKQNWSIWSFKVLSVLSWKRLLKRWFIFKYTKRYINQIMKNHNDCKSLLCINLENIKSVL